MYCLDTAPLIWGVQGTAHPTQSEMPGRTRRFLKHCREESIRLIVPAPAWSEFLVKLPPEEHDDLTAIITDGPFILAPFDFQAAKIAAELEHDRARFKVLQRGLADGEDVSMAVARQMVKVDVQIAAIAVVYAATAVVTHDIDHFTDILKGKGVTVSGVPEVTTGDQLDLLL